MIRRNVLENPAWYTAYTPYQPEISQGRLEALLNFQTVVEDLTGLAIAGASVLDEATAAAEAMALAHRASAVGRHVRRRRRRPAADPRRRAHAGRAARPRRRRPGPLPSRCRTPACSACSRSTPARAAPSATSRRWPPPRTSAGALFIVAADLLALTLITPPGELGADIAVGTTQRFGVPMGFGGPHAGYLAVRSGLERQLPGRLVGVSVDADGAPAYRLALQTREQHIRREKATSNICTAQVLLAVIASMYAVYHGPDGLRAIARRVHRLAAILAAGLREAGQSTSSTAAFFDTVTVRVPGRAPSVVAAALDRGINLRLVDADTVARQLRRADHPRARRRGLGGVRRRPRRARRRAARRRAGDGRRRSATPLPRAHVAVPDPPGVPRAPLGDRDAALPAPPRRPRLRARPRHDPARLLHDEAQRDDRDGADHQSRLRRPAPVRAGRASSTATRSCSPTCRTGWPRSPATTRCRCSPTPGRRASSPGCSRSTTTTAPAGEQHRDVCLIPACAHGTNAASAVMAGMRVVVVRTSGEQGEIDLDDLRAKIAAARRRRWPRSWSPTRRRTACSRSTSARSARWCTTPAARSTSTARTSTRWSASRGRAASAPTSRT